MIPRWPVAYSDLSKLAMSMVSTLCGISMKRNKIDHLIPAASLERENII